MTFSILTAIRPLEIPRKVLAPEDRRPIRDRSAVRAVATRYGTALAIATSGILLRLALNPYLERSGFAISLGAMLLAAWVGGVGPSLMSQTLILAGEALFFAAPRTGPWQPSLRAFVSLGAFYAVGTIVALLSEARRAAQRREQQQRDEAIQQREQLRATFTCIGDGVLVADTEGRLTLMNPVAEAMIGWSLAESRGKPIRNLFAICEEDSPESFEHPVERVLRTGELMHHISRLMITTRNPRRLPVAYSASPIHDGAGAITGVVITFSDETERRRTEQALRTADKNKDEFLAMLAHELRNPLAPICMGLDLMKLSDGETDETEEIRVMMERQARHMVRLIDDLLDVSRITRGTLELKRRRVAVAEVVRNAIETTKPLFEESRHELRVAQPEADVWINADSDRLTQVLANLLNNAAKYTPAGGRIELCVEPHAGDVAISVADNGRGIPSNMLGNIFEMFTQLRGAMESGHKGLGIGLTLVKRLVELHGGMVRAESKGDGMGSEFEIRLPTVGSSADGEVQSHVAGEASSSVAKRRVLIVDDNEDALRTLSMLVELLGNETYQARDGLEAIAATETVRPDVVLMDLGMPRMNGYDAAQRIRQSPWGTDVALIALTGWGQEESRQRTKEAGFDFHLVKPVEPAKLQQLMAELAPPRLHDAPSGSRPNEAAPANDPENQLTLRA